MEEFFRLNLAFVRNEKIICFRSLRFNKQNGRSFDLPFDPPLDDVGPIPVLTRLNIDSGQNFVNNNFQITLKATRVTTQLQQQMGIYQTNNQVIGMRVPNLLKPETN